MTENISADDIAAHNRAMAHDMALMRGRLARIAEAHHKNVDEHGGTFGDCNECSWTWPCPTFIWATTTRDPVLDAWDPSNDEKKGEETP